MAEDSEVLIRVRREGRAEAGGAGDDEEEAPGVKGRGGGFRGAFLGGAIGAIAGPLVAGILRPITDLLAPMGAGLGTVLLEPFLAVLERLSRSIELLDNFISTAPARAQDFAEGVQTIAGNLFDPSSEYRTGPARPGSALERARDRYAAFTESRPDIPGFLAPAEATVQFGAGVWFGLQEVARTLTGRTEADQAHNPDAIYRNPQANRAAGGGYD